MPDFPENEIKREYAYAFMSYSANPAETTAGEGRWAQGPAPDARGEFTYIAEPFGQGEMRPLPPAPAKVYDNLPGEPTGDVEKPAPAQAGSLLGKLEDKLTGG